MERKRIHCPSDTPHNRTQDRLSELPDGVLHYILSLLPMKSATRTSILSKKWKNKRQCLWSYATTLDFGREFTRGQTQEEFASNVNRILNLHNGKKVDSCRIFFYPSNQYLSDIEKWVKFVTWRGVKELCLDFSEGIHFYDGIHLDSSVHFLRGRKRIKLPCCLFDCAVLTHLTLNFIDLSPFLNFNVFGSLEALCLKQVNITDDMLLTLFSDCPLLEDLSLIECSHLSRIKVDTPRLKRLTVYTCYCGYYLEISAPNLQSFLFEGEIFHHTFRDISSLEDAFICSEELVYYDFSHDRTKMLSDLAHVKILTTCSVAISHLEIAEEYGSEDWPITFPNMRELQLIVQVMGDLSPAYGFFRNSICPRLEKIFIRLPYDPENVLSKEVSEIPDTNPSDYTFHYLKAVQIDQFSGCQKDMLLVKFFLEKALVLEHLVLIAPYEIEGTKKDHATQRESIEMPLKLLYLQLLLLPKASQSAHIELCGYSENHTSLGPTHNDFYCNV